MRKRIFIGPIVTILTLVMAFLTLGTFGSAASAKSSKVRTTCQLALFRRGALLRTGTTSPMCPSSPMRGRRLCFMMT